MASINIQIRLASHLIPEPSRDRRKKEVKHLIKHGGRFVVQKNRISCPSEFARKVPVVCGFSFDKLSALIDLNEFISVGNGKGREVEG